MILKIFISLFFFACFASAQAPSGDEILRRCERNFDGVEDYTVDLTAAIDMDRIRIPEMKALLYFKRPDKINIKSESFAMLPRDGFALPVTVLVRNYDVRSRGVEEIEGIRLYRIELTAKKGSARVQNLTVWVDPANFTVVQTVSTPYRGRSVTVQTSYMLLENKFWLPERMKLSFAATLPDSSTADEFPIPGQGESEGTRRPPRSGSMEIRYSGYRVNTGLSDDLFKRETE
jgi:outer membrane lipoprotein-sorting protein